jgi:nucleoside-diphosphate-sugar epimerase
MRVFVTGAAGFIGSAVVRDLLDAGHRVTGMVRSEETAGSVAAAGADVHRGTLDDLDGLRGAAAAADGVVHLAYVHDFSDMAAAAATDRAAIEALGAGLAGTGRPLVIASGVLLAAPRGEVATEEDPAGPQPRGRSEDTLFALAERGVRASAVRLAPTVHGRGDRGFVRILIDIAREKGVSAYVGDGANRWPAVHRLDAARLFRLAVEGAPAGSRLHAVDDEGVPLREIAGVIGRHLGVPVRGVSAEEAPGHFGWFAPIVSADAPASSVRTREALGWEPAGARLLTDLDEGHYFADGETGAAAS